MELTIMGMVTAAVGLLLLFQASAAQTLNFLVLCSLLGGGAAINLPALGGSSIPPAYFALAFLLTNLALKSHLKPEPVLWSLRTNGFLAVFVLYGAVGAFILPRVFAGALELPPMRASLTDTSPYAAEPLMPSSQNVTQAVYMIGALVTALAATLVAATERHAEGFLKAMLAASWIHIAFGVLDLAFNAAGLPDALGLFRNGSYAQLNQAANGFHRISGIFPEPSAYAAFGFMLFVFAAELWLRGVRPRLTGLTAVAMAAILVLCTSSAGYVGLFLYGALLVVRLLFVSPSGRSMQKLLHFTSLVLISATALILLTMARPGTTEAMTQVVGDMTTHKAASESGIQRMFWVRMGIEAFKASHGLGVGPGSFRSSSLATAILGSTGVVGAAAFVLYLLRVLRPLRLTTHRLDGLPPERAIGIAAAWAAILGLIPAATSGSAPDPGVLFAILAGVALGWAPARPLAEGPPMEGQPQRLSGWRRPRQSPRRRAPVPLSPRP